MTFELLIIESKSSGWFEEVMTSYQKKISPFIAFKIHKIKSSKLGRDDRVNKVIDEAKKISKYLNPTDTVVLFDEEGKEYASSESFSKEIKQLSESGVNKVVFVIGGAFGVSEEIKNRANKKIKLSNLVMNHQMAASVCLEQIYRSFTIIKGLPYHNK